VSCLLSAVFLVESAKLYEVFAVESANLCEICPGEDVVGPDCRHQQPYN